MRLILPSIHQLIQATMRRSKTKTCVRILNGFRRIYGDSRQLVHEGRLGILAPSAQ
jgi:hypothetical protein